MVRDGDAPARIHERAILMAALANELQHVMKSAIGAQGADVLTAALIECARQM